MLLKQTLSPVGRYQLNPLSELSERGKEVTVYLYFVSFSHCAPAICRLYLRVVIILYITNSHCLIVVEAGLCQNVEYCEWMK